MARKSLSRHGYRYTDSRGYFCWRLSLGSREDAKPIVIKRKTHAEREKAVKAKLKELDERGTLKQASEEQTVKDRLAWWLKYKIEPHREPKTYTSYELTCRLHVVPFIGTVKVSKVTPQHLQEIVVHVKGQNLSDRQAEYAVSVLLRGLPRREATLLRAALAEGDVTIPTAAKPRDRVLEHGEIDAVLATAYQQVELKTRPGEIRSIFRDRFLLDFLLNAGLRISEALGLLILDVDLKRRGIRVTKQLEWKKRDKDAKHADWSLKDRTKTGDDRWVPLNDAARSAVKGQIALISADKERAGTGYDDFGLLFATESGRAMSPRNVLRSLDTIIKRTTIKGPRGKDVPLRHATLHDLRRSFAKV